MATMADTSAEPSVKRSITVKAGVEKAFRVFTEEFDSWWPREHHIGNAPMKRSIVETREGGRCYTEHVDGSESDWGRVLVWEPPRRLLIAWLINPQWKPEPDVARSSEVEILFTPVGSGATRVDLEHRLFSRMGEGGASMREGVSAEGGWGTLLEMFAKKAEEAGSS